MNRLVIALCLLAAVPAFGAAIGLPSLDESKALANQSTLLLAQEKFDGGFQVLKRHWPLPDAELQVVIRQTTADWPSVRQRYGRTQGITYLGEQRLSPTLIRYSYLHRFEKGSGQWQFTFQQYRGTWLVDGVAFVEGKPAAE
ncbi:MAG: hypothetical protein ABL964_14320 [Steroidobacteraceae bacterium]